MYPYPSLLTLDHSTLFYWTLSDASHKKWKHPSAIKEWVSESKGRTTVYASQAQASISISTRTKSAAGIPSLTSGVSRSSASVLTNNVIVSCRASDSVKVKTNPGSAPGPTVSIRDDGGLSDNDELRGGEQDVAINSPIKGKRHVTSEVFFLFC
jgi:hypothetical protein